MLSNKNTKAKWESKENLATWCATPLQDLLIQTNEQEKKKSAKAMVLSSWVQMHQGKGWLGALMASKHILASLSKITQLQFSALAS